MFRKLAALSVVASMISALPVAAQVGKREDRRDRARIEAPRSPAIRGEAHGQRDPLGIIQRQGISSLHGGMGNMGGGSGRSANTGIGLGAHGNSQGPRH